MSVHVKGITSGPLYISHNNGYPGDYCDTFNNAIPAGGMTGGRGTSLPFVDPPNIENPPFFFLGFLLCPIASSN